jgi:enoyl-[acyl-carrier-protein] reductase (NADH)
LQQEHEVRLIQLKSIQPAHALRKTEAPLSQLVTIEAIGEVTAFLISNEARFITGQIIYVDGGYNIKG